MSDMPAVNVSGLKKVFNPGKPSQVDALVDGVFEDEEEQQLAYAAITAESLRLNRLVSDLLDVFPPFVTQALRHAPPSRSLHPVRI